jgi:hypothetical protein
MSGTQRLSRLQANDLAQSPADPVAFHGIADLARHRKPDAGRGLVASIARLQDKPGGWHLEPACGGQKIRSLSQTLHAGSAFRAVPDQALRRLRPRARRAEMTLRPPVVSMRARKP